MNGKNQVMRSPPHLHFYNTIASGVIKRFLENLLPEGKGLDDLTSFTHISKNNIKVCNNIRKALDGHTIDMTLLSNAEKIFIDKLHQLISKRVDTLALSADEMLKASYE